MIVYGGFDTRNPTQLWQLALSGTPAWQALAASKPLAESSSGYHSGLYDPVRDEFDVADIDHYAVVGGIAAYFAALPLGAPTWLTGYLVIDEHATTVYDSRRDQTIKFGGLVEYFGTSSNATVAKPLSGGAGWSLATTVPGRPPARSGGYSMSYDPVRDRAVVFKASTTWALTLAGTPAWFTLAPENSVTIDKSVIAYDPSRDRMLVGGYDPADLNGPHAFDRAWALTWGEPARPLVSSVSGNLPWTPGQTLSVDYALTNPLAEPHAIGWRLESARGWPAVPAYGITVVNGGATQTVSIPVPMPDTVAAGTHALTLNA